ncbi:tyrosine-type recombinase/integrase [Rothia amarae]|uniref:tyrosine-type recombinase/integrase n=1 Tax=Rothia amarae TaxID=169480 RepID=UPI0033F8D203
MAALKELARRESAGTLAPIPKPKKGSQVLTGALTVEQYAKIWLSQQKKAGGATLKTYESALRLHIYPVIGEKALLDVSKADITALMEHCANKVDKYDELLLGYSPLNKIYGVLARIFKSAEEQDLILKTPVISTHKPVMPTREDLIRTQKVVQRRPIAHRMLIDATAHRNERTLEYVWLRLMFLGLRQGERGGLLFSDIDNLDSPGQAVMNIRHQIAGEGRGVDGVGKGIYIKDSLKTKDSYRSLAIDEDLRLALCALYEQRTRAISEGTLITWSERKNDKRFDDLVLLTEGGSPYYQQMDCKRWKAYRMAWADKYAKTPAEHALITERWAGHVNRKITATMLYMLNTPIHTARQVLGHGSEAMTEYYTAFESMNLAPAINALASLTSANAYTSFESERLQSNIVIAGRPWSELKHEYSTPDEARAHLEGVFIDNTVSDKEVARAKALTPLTPELAKAMAVGIDQIKMLP